MKILLACLFIMLFMIVPALAQTGGEESPGGQDNTPTPVVGEATPVALPTLPAIKGAAVRLDTPLTVILDGTTAVNLSYKSNGAETITITARSLAADDVLDPSLAVLDASGAVVASNDDHRTSRTDLAPTDALIASLSLTGSGRYLIQVASSTGQSGDVEVVVTAGGTIVPQTNQTIDDRVPADQPYTYPFQANAGDVLTITVHATDELDPVLSLLDSSGTEIATNDDLDNPSDNPQLGTYDSQIANFTIPATDTYTIQIERHDALGGDFELTINQGDGGTVIQTIPTPTQAPDVHTTQVVEGTVKSNDVYTYSFDAQVGDMYTITVAATSDDLDPRIAVYLDDSFVLDNDDYGSTDPDMLSTDARIYDWIVTDTGTYEFDISGYSDTSGDFKMTIERLAVNAPTGLPSENVELASVSGGDTYTYSFDAQAGDYVTITARYLTKDADPYIMLMSADGTVLLDNDNNGSSYGELSFYDAQIPNFIIPETGSYTVEVSDVNGATATYGLTVGTLK